MQSTDGLELQGFELPLLAAAACPASVPGAGLELQGFELPLLGFKLFSDEKARSRVSNCKASSSRCWAAIRQATRDRLSIGLELQGFEQPLLER